MCGTVHVTERCYSQLVRFRIGYFQPLELVELPGLSIAKGNVDVAIHPSIDPRVVSSLTQLRIAAKSIFDGLLRQRSSASLEQRINDRSYKVCRCCLQRIALRVELVPTAIADRRQRPELASRKRQPSQYR